ncbi:response regulator [Methylocella sp.]|uniref:response regulator n=1 Tax=Methylocella sp. TaxID=1978226 RepID=UPI003782D36E
MGTTTTRSQRDYASRALPAQPVDPDGADACVVVNMRFEILSCAGPVARYLTSPDPRPGSALAAALPPGLSGPALGALRRAAGPCAAGGASAVWRGGGVLVTLHARRVRDDGDDAILLSFSEDADDAEDEGARDPDAITEPQSMTSVETELDFGVDRTRLEDALRTLELVNDGLALANHEAATLNEELRRRVDELEAAQAEARALNGELREVNRRLEEDRARDARAAAGLLDILESADVATLALGADFSIRFFTPRATGLFGLIASDVGRPLSDLAPRVEDIHLTDDIRSALAGRPVAAREVRARDGSWFLRMTAPRRFGGDDAGVVITYVAIGGLKRAEDELRAAGAYLESVLETVRKPLLTFDRSLSVRSVNKACRELFDADREAFLGRPLGETPAAALAPFLMDMLWPGSATLGDVENHRLQIETPGGGELILLTTLRRMAGACDDAFLLSLDDVTEKERVEESLAAVTRGLEKANRLKSQFLAAASHDLRQPLQTMCLLSAILRRKLTGRALQLSAKFDETIEAMNGVVNAILDINQLEAGAITPVIQSFPADMLLNKLFAEFDTLVQAKGLDWRLVGCGAVVKSDPRLLIQILRNLVSNAIKFTASGKILIGCRRRGDAISIEVLDSGPGVRESEIASIFEFFHKGAENLKGSDDGLGLGLAIVRHLATMLGHEVKVQSRFGRGSRFSVLVPLGEAEATVDAKPARLPPPVMRDRACRILIVEDEPSVRESLEMLLEAEGHAVCAAASGPAALRLVESGVCLPDLVIVDYSVPGGMNGLETIDAVRGALGRRTPAIALTGDISSAAIEKIKAGADAHLTKPVQADDLLDAIQALRADARAAAESCLAGELPHLPPPREELREATVYIVDDDSNVRSSLRELLESCGYAARPLASGLDVEGLAFRPEDCLILDANLPDLDGFEVLARLKSAAARPSVIMITGRGDVDTAVRAMREGACDFLEKPFSPEQLLKSLGRALEAKAPAADVRREARQRVGRLTERQRAVLDLIVAGRANKVIANDLGIGQRTVESHRATLMKKLGVRTFADLIRMAIAAR